MASISIEQPPHETDEFLTEYLSRMFIQINGALQRDQDYKVLYVVPGKVKPGKIYYFGRAILPDITSEGWWGRKSTGWVQLG